MATSTGASRRKAPGTHPSVWAGLVLAIVGLLLAMYAYTGTRVYDITFAYVAIGGGALAFIGIMVAAWGRAVMAARAQRTRRGLAAKPVASAREVPVEAPESSPPTVAAPAEKRSALRIPALPKLGRRKKEPAPAADKSQLFQFKRRSAPPQAASAAPAVVEVTPEPAPAPEAATPAPAPDVTADGAPVRITMKCPQCGAEFSAEGVQPLTVTCPSCGLSGTV